MMKQSEDVYGTPVHHIKHIEHAKRWAAVLGIIFVFLVSSDLLFVFQRSRDMGSWFFGAGEFQQNGEIISNKGRSSETGIWITGESHALQQRGAPRWITNGVGLLAVFQILRHLKKSYSMPGRQRQPDQSLDND